MKPRMVLLVLLAAFSILSAGCAAQEVAGASNEEPAGSPGRMEDQASLIEALQAAGAEVEPGDSIEQAFFSVPGEILKVNGADVQVFEYESAEALGTEASQISPNGSTIGTSMVSWMEAPHFFRSGRLLVLYVGQDQAILDLLQGILGEQFAGR